MFPGDGPLNEPIRTPGDVAQCELSMNGLLAWVLIQIPGL